MKLRTGWKHSLLPSLCSENKYFAIAIKNFDKAGIKVFCFCPILPDISLFSLAASHSKKCFFRSEIFFNFHATRFRMLHVDTIIFVANFKHL